MANAGENITLTCVVDGDPPPFITWRKDLELLRPDRYAQWNLLNGHLPIAATSLTQPLDVVPIEVQYLRILLNADTSLLLKADRVFGPSSTWLVQNSLDNADACMPFTWMSGITD